MIRNAICVIIFFIGIQNLAIAFQPKGEYIIVRNNTNGYIMINKKFHILNENWQMELEGLDVGILNYFGDRISPNKQEICIAYYPAYGLLEAIEKHYFEKLAAISFTDKLNAIFTEFIITDVDGSVLYDITDMKEDDFIVECYDDAHTIRYILEISD
jgi:hypothetical protein